jgi:hypothetical protein
MVSFSKYPLLLLFTFILFVISCGYDSGNSPGGAGQSTAGGGGGGPVTYNVSSVGANSCDTINVSSYIGCTVKRYTVTTTPGNPPAFSTYVLPCSSCGACPYGTALSTISACGCSTPGYIHFNMNEILAWTAFPSTAPGAGHVISSSQLSVYMTDLTASGTSGEIELEIECN